MNLNEIENLLKKSKHFKVNSEQDGQILKALDNINIEREFHKSIKKPAFFTFLTQFNMNIKKYAAAALVAVLVIGGFWYYTQNSYAYHLNKARSALAQLEAVISGNPSQVSLIPVAFAEGEEPTVDEDQIADLTEEVVEETEEAIEIAEEITDPEDLEEALEEISDLQEEEIEVFADAAEVVESDMATEVVAEALETTSAEQESVEDALDFVEDASEGGEEEVNIDVETSEDQETNERLERAQVRHQEAERILVQLREDGASDEEIQQLEKKMAKVQLALEEGKSGRAFGLSTAMQAQSKHILRKLEKAEVEEEEGEEGEEEEEEEEGEEGEEEEEAVEEEEVDEHLARAQERYEDAQAAFNELKESDIDEEELEQMEGKMAKVEVAFEEGKVGRAFGLSTAVQATSKSMILKIKKQAEREAKKAARETGKDKGTSQDNNEDEEEEGEEEEEGDEGEDESGQVQAENQVSTEAQEQQQAGQAEEGNESGQVQADQVRTEAQEQQQAGQAE